jgi:hypothetical protein
MRLSSGWGSRKCLETNYLRSKIFIRKDLRVDFKVSAPILVQTVDYVCGKTRDYGRLDGKQPSAVEADDNTARLSARLNSLVKKSGFQWDLRKSMTQGLNRPRKKGRFAASEPLQGLKPTGSIGFIGTTKVMPCYKARFERVFQQHLMPGELVGQTSGTTEVVPFQSSNELGGKG